MCACNFDVSESMALWVHRSQITAQVLSLSLLQPMPPHHPTLGHIALSARILRRIPKNAHGHYLADQINRVYPDLGSSFY